MRLLILGHSRIVQRRLLPALARLDAVEQADIASRRPAAGAARAAAPAAAPRGEVYEGYDDALRRSGAQLAWVSGVNTDHAPLAERCLQRGLHVIVDKPAATRLRDAERLLALARERNLCLAEATVFAHHPQVELVREQFARRQDAPSRVTATFSVPPFTDDNFRWRRELGGGALLDMGIYAAATARLLFGEAPGQEPIQAPLQWHARVLGRRGGVDTAFACLGVAGARALVGQFGFDTEYCNRLQVLGTRTAVSLERAFTTAPDEPNVLAVSAANRHEQVTAPAGDSFGLFVQAVIASIAAGRHGRWAEILWQDARALHALRTAAGEDDA